MLYFSSAMVAKEIIELLLGFGKKGIAAPVDDVDVLAGVRMVEAETMNIGIGRIDWRCAAASD